MARLHPARKAAKEECTQARTALLAAIDANPSHPLVPQACKLHDAARRVLQMSDDLMMEHAMQPCWPGNGQKDCQVAATLYNVAKSLLDS